MNSQNMKTYISLSICTGLNNGKFLLDLFLEKTLQHFYRIKSTRKWETEKFLGHVPNGKSNLSKYENLYISSSVYTGLHYSKFQFYLFIKKGSEVFLSIDINSRY